MTAPRASATVRTSKNQEAQRFYPQLDGLRAFAVMFVLMRHTDDVRLPVVLGWMHSVGWAGVDAFFVLSGFLITKILLGASAGPRAFGLFVLRRTLRTWPLYFAVLLVSFLTLRHTATGAEINWLQHLFFMQNYAAKFVARSLGPTWSLCVEEHFYFLWPFVVFLLPRRALFWILPAIFWLLPLGRYWGLHFGVSYQQIYTETQFHLDGLVAGSFVALLASQYTIRAKMMKRIAYSLLALGAGTTFWGFRRSWSVDTGHNVVFGFTSLAAAFAGLLMLLLRGEPAILVRIFSLGPLRYVGRISYGIYLLHEGINPLVTSLPLHRILGVAAGSWMFVIPFRFGLALFAAALSYQFIESPILRIKDRLR